MAEHIDVLGAGRTLGDVSNLDDANVVLEDLERIQMTGRVPGRACDMPTCSASVVERAMMDCSWEAERIGIPQWNRT